MVVKNTDLPEYGKQKLVEYRKKEIEKTFHYN